MSSNGPALNRTLIEAAEEALESIYAKHNAFNEQFNKRNDSIVIQSLIPTQKPYEFDPSEVVYWLDRSGYEAELKAWRERNVRDANAEAIRLVLDREQQAVLHDLAAAIQRRRIAPFVGAGLSAFTFPTWGEALRAIISRIADLDKDAVEEAIRSCDYLRAAQMLWDADSMQVKVFIRERFGRSRIRPGGARGAVRMLPKISHGCVITTNYDAVIEEVIGNGQFEGYMHGTQQSNKFVPRLISGDRCLLKLHGDAEDDSSFILTNDHYASSYGDPIDYNKPLAATLRHIFLSHSVLFLGCSLDHDKTLELLRETCDASELYVPDHYAIVEEPDSARQKTEKDQRLRSMKIRPLWYSHGKHYLVEQILELALALADETITSLETPR